MENKEDEFNLLKKAFELSGEELKEIYNLLTPLEQTILSVLLIERSALSVKVIRNKIIDYLIEFFKSPFRTIKNRKYYYFFRFLDIPYELQSQIMSELKEKLENTKTPSERRKIAEKIFKKHGIVEIPSFQTIEKILIELVASGLVIRRKPIIATKTKFVYAVNPKLLKELDKDVYEELEK
jgi:predicted transcriptional regulator